MSNYPFYGFWTALDVVNIVTQCLSFLDSLHEKSKTENKPAPLDIPKARKEYQTVLEIISRFEKAISFYDITSNRVRSFIKIDDDFYTENVILKRSKAAEWSGLSNKQYLDTLIKNDTTKMAADKFLSDMKNVIKK